MIATFIVFPCKFDLLDRRVNLQPAWLYIVVYHAVAHSVLLQATAFSLDTDKLHPLRARLEASLACRIDADRVALAHRLFLAVDKERTAAF